MIRRLVHSELLKVRTRATFWVLVGALVLMLGILALILSFAPATDLEDGQEFIAFIPNIGFFVPLIVGILLVTGEFWHKTMTHTLLATPQREIVMATKFAAAAVAGLAYTLVSIALAFGLAFPVLAIRDIEFAVDASGLAKTTALVSAVMVLYGVLGAAIGAVVRNQVAAMVGALVWFLIVELIVAPFVPADIRKYSPWSASVAINAAGEDTAGELLSGLGGGLVFAAYALALAAIGTALTARRDVT